MLKTLNTRIQHKYDTQENWDSNSTTIRALSGELLIYSDGYPGISTKPLLKVGNGIDLPKDLPFITGSSLPTPEDTNATSILQYKPGTGWEAVEVSIYNGEVSE